MRVLHVVPYLPRASGVTTFVVRVSDELQEIGVENCIAIKEMGASEIAESWRGALRIPADEALLRMREFDVVHFHGIWPPFMHLIVKKALKYNKPMVWSLHGMLSPWALKHKWWKKVLPWLLWQKHDLRAAAILHVTSEKELEWVRARGFKNRIVNIPLGTNLPDAVAVRRHEKKTLLFVGRINPVKGLENLIRAWKLAQCNGWKLRLIGTDEAKYTGELTALVQDLSLQASIEFPGPKFGEDLNAEYRNADALILPSFTENFGGVVVDALAWSLPVVTSKGTPWRVVEENGCGWWVDNTPESLAKALRELVALSDGERQKMGERGRRLVAEKYAWSAVARQMMDAYGLLPCSDGMGENGKLCGGRDGDAHLKRVKG